MLKNLFLIATAALLAACGNHAAADACRVGSSACSEWVLLTRPGTPPQKIAEWLEARGWSVRRRLDDLNTLLVWLPRGGAEEAAVRSIVAQPWAGVVTPQPVTQPMAPP